jgi:flagellar motility protein MotE (MotC chaperone)
LIWKSASSSLKIFHEMADKEQAKSKRNSMGLLGYGAFFIGSFLLTFGALYVGMRGFTNPFAKHAPVVASDSTDVAIDSTVVEKPKEVSPDSALKRNIEIMTEREIQQRVDTIVQDTILVKDEEIEELKQQVQTLEFAYEENRRRYEDLRAKSVSADTLARLIAELETEKRNTQQQAETIIKMDSVSLRLKSMVSKAQLEDSTHKKVPLDSLKKVLARVEKEKQEKVAQLATIDELKKTIETLQIKKKEAQANSIDVRDLAKVYDVMKPTEAAAVIAALDNQIVVPLLKAVKKRQAAKILAALPPQRAATLSQQIGIK